MSEKVLLVDDETDFLEVMSERMTTRGLPVSTSTSAKDALKLTQDENYDAVVLDLMIHDIGVILQLVRSPIEKIDSVGVQVLTRTEDIANARITFANGCVANINTSRVSEKAVREIRVFQPATYLSLNFAEQKGHVIQKDGFALKKEEVPIEKGEPLMLELASFAESVQKRAEPKVGATLGKTALEVAIQITEQIRANGAFA